MTFGVTYTAVVGRSATYVDWAVFSARTVKKHMSNVRTSVYTNRPSLVREHKLGVFVDDILVAPDYDDIDSRGAMMDGILASEDLGYDVTLFTGADTVFCGSVLDEMDLMATGKFDLALTLVTDQRQKRKHSLRGVHKGFPYYRDGVLIFPWNTAVRAFMLDWRALYKTHRDECGEVRKGRWHPTIPPMNEALYKHSNLRLVFLPDSYCATFWTGCLYGPAKIMHVHGAGGRRAEKMGIRLNENSDRPRLFRERKIIP